jgi:hypothetical protein
MCLSLGFDRQEVRFECYKQVIRPTGALMEPHKMDKIVVKATSSDLRKTVEHVDKTPFFATLRSSQKSRALSRLAVRDDSKWAAPKQHKGLRGHREPQHAHAAGEGHVHAPAEPASTVAPRSLSDRLRDFVGSPEVDDEFPQPNVHHFGPDSAAAHARWAHANGHLGFDNNTHGRLRAAFIFSRRVTLDLT